MFLLSNSWSLKGLYPQSCPVPPWSLWVASPLFFLSHSTGHKARKQTPEATVWVLRLWLQISASELELPGEHSKLATTLMATQIPLFILYTAPCLSWRDLACLSACPVHFRNGIMIGACVLSFPTCLHAETNTPRQKQTQKHLHGERTKQRGVLVLSSLSPESGIQSMEWCCPHLG